MNNNHLGDVGAYSCDDDNSFESPCKRIRFMDFFYFFKKAVRLITKAIWDHYLVLLFFRILFSIRSSIIFILYMNICEFYYTIVQSRV